MIFRNSLLLAVLSVLSVLFGIVRDRLLAEYVGVGPILDVYNASFRLPDLLYGAMLAFMTAGTVVPFLTKENKNGEIVESQKRFTTIFFFFGLLMIFVSMIIAITIPLYAKFIVPGFNDFQLSEFIFATRLLMVQPIILGVSALISCFAQIRNEFILFGVAPLGYSLGVIIGVVFFYPMYGFNGLIFGVILGSVLALAIQSVTLYRDKFKFKLNNFNFSYIKDFVKLAIPRTGTNVVSQLRVIFFTAFATTLGPGVLSSFLFAQRITDAVSQIISQSVTTVSLPVLSREYEESRMVEHKQLVHKYTRILFLIAVLVSSIIFIFRDLIIYVLYGANDANKLIAYILIGFLVILPFQMATHYFTIALYSMKDTKKVFSANLFATIFSLIVCILNREQGVISLVYGVVTLYVTLFLLIFISYSRKNGAVNALEIIESV